MTHYCVVFVCGIPSERMERVLLVLDLCMMYIPSEGMEGVLLLSDLCTMYFLRAWNE